MSKKTPPAPVTLGWGRYFVRGNSELNSEADKERLQLVVHWFRQLLAIICGVIWGLSPLSGFIGIAGYITLYYYYYQLSQINVNIHQIYGD